MAFDDIYGMRVIIDDSVVPKMQLSADCPVTEDYRADTNAWMIRFFGVRKAIPDGQVLNGKSRFIMNSCTWNALKKAAQPAQAGADRAGG